jgi:transposase
MIFERLIPKDHLLVKIDSLIDFSFVYEIVKDNYSDIGRKSEDPVVLFKLNLLEYLYRLSDPDVITRSQTDVAFRWFLGLNLDDELPDDTTISYFRIHRMDEQGFEGAFNEIVKKCIENNLVGRKRYMVDSTNVDANVNYPSMRRLICNAFRKVIKEIDKFNSCLAAEILKAFEQDIDSEYEKSDKVPVLKFCEIARKHAEYIYLKTYDELQGNKKFQDAYSIFWDIVEQYSIASAKDKIISCVDPDARVAHKSPGVTKKGYKDHIIVDEESEIILASAQTPFNVNDEKELVNLIEKTKDNFGLEPEEVSADKVYGTVQNRAYLKDENIKTNIHFYDEPDKENKYFGINDFNISPELEHVSCPNNITASKHSIVCNKAIKQNEIVYYFDKSTCSKCPLREKCYSTKNRRGRTLKIYERYDAVIRDKKHNETHEFQNAINKRYKIERRFATLVRNHGLRRSRFIKLKRTRLHIIMANTACNIVRMVNLIFNRDHSSIATPKIA